jgi:glycosyltransferase involved in cell wall biosynthesis
MKLKVAVFEPHPNHQGGSERIAFDVAGHLASCGHQVFLQHDATGSLLPEYSEFVSGTHHMMLRAFGWRTLSATLRRTRAAAQQWRKWNVDVVFSSDVNYLRFLALAGVIARKPVVLHLGIANPLAYFSQKKAFRFFAAGIAPSQHTADSWRNQGWPASWLHVVPNGVNTTRFQPAKNRDALRQSLAIPSHRMVIVYVGRLVPEKGIATLLDALAELHRARVDFFSVFVGAAQDGTTTHWAAVAREKGLPENVALFTGRRADPEKFFAAADLAVVPSEWEEPFGLVPLEAMACGALPIVSDRGILPQLVGRPELVFAAGNSDQLAERLRYWGNETQLREALTDELSRRVPAMHSSAIMAEAYESILLSCVSRNA